MLRTPICNILGCRYPIIEGGMVYIGGGRLAGAISEAGGFGMIGAGSMSPDQLQHEIRAAREVTSQPFGANIPLGISADPEGLVRMIIEEKVAAVSLSAGNPVPWINKFKEKDIRVMILAGTVRHARNAEKAGADAVIVEGYEAGGHNSPFELTTMTLVPQVVAEVGIPVVAAGGIANGAGLVAALALGADGIQIGTRFVATSECQAHDNYKQAILNANDEGTAVLERSIGRVMRVLKGSYVDMFLEKEKGLPGIEELLPYMSGERNKLAAIDGRLGDGYAYAGQVAGLISEVVPAKEVVEKLVREAEDTLRRLAELKY